MRTVVIGVVVGSMLGSGVWLSAQSRRSTAVEQMAALAGSWTRNRNPDAGGRQSEAPVGRRGGGIGGPFDRGLSAGISPIGRGNPEQSARRREAFGDITDPPDRLVITVTETMVMLTAPDGRTTRLAPDGSKIKDENISVERQTRWTAGKLVSEIAGLGPKITQTLSVDAERRQLRVLVEIGASGVSRARTATYVYDADQH